MTAPLIHQDAIDRLIARAANMLDYIPESVALETFIREGCPAPVAINAVRAGAILSAHRAQPATTQR